jgi:hypothetical protein
LAGHQSLRLPQQVLNVQLRPAIDARRPGPYLSSMAPQSIVRTQSILGVLVCLQLLASLLLGPLCAVRCAACAPVSANDMSEPCHSPAQLADTCVTFKVPAVAPCATSEFLFTPPRTETLFPADKSFAAFSPVLPLHVPEPASLAALFSRAAVSEHLILSTFSPNIPLRI